MLSSRPGYTWAWCRQRRGAWLCPRRRWGWSRRSRSAAPWGTCPLAGLLVCLLWGCCRQHRGWACHHPDRGECSCQVTHICRYLPVPFYQVLSKILFVDLCLDNVKLHKCHNCSPTVEAGLCLTCPRQTQVRNHPHSSASNRPHTACPCPRAPRPLSGRRHRRGAGELRGERAWAWLRAAGVWVARGRARFI